MILKANHESLQVIFPFGLKFLCDKDEINIIQYSVIYYNSITSLCDGYVIEYPKQTKSLKISSEQ